MKRLFLLTIAVLLIIKLGAQSVLYEYVHPDGQKVYHGFWTVDTGTMDWQQTKGLRFMCFSDGGNSEGK